MPIPTPPADEYDGFKTPGKKRKRGDASSDSETPTKVSRLSDEPIQVPFLYPEP